METTKQTQQECADEVFKNVDVLEGSIKSAKEHGLTVVLRQRKYAFAVEDEKAFDCEITTEIKRSPNL